MGPTYICVDYHPPLMYAIWNAELLFASANKVLPTLNESPTDQIVLLKC